MAEMNDKERNLVNLINQLSELADDENTAQGVIDGMVNRIRTATAKGIEDDMGKFNEQDGSEETPHHSKDYSMEQKMKILEEIEKRQQAIEGAERESEFKLPNIVFTRIREVKKPGKAHPTDAGIDFYVPDEKSWDEDFKANVLKYSQNPDDGMVHFEQDENKGNHQIMVVEPDAHVAIPSGIKTILPQGLGMMFVNKSGIATKKKLDLSACLVDSEYRDEVIMCFFNHSQVPITIEPGMKITQGLIVPIYNLEMQEVLNCVYDDMGKDSDRGGGFGSSGTK